MRKYYFNSDFATLIDTSMKSGTLASSNFESDISNCSTVSGERPSDTISWPSCRNTYHSKRYLRCRRTEDRLGKPRLCGAIPTSQNHCTFDPKITEFGSRACWHVKDVLNGPQCSPNTVCGRDCTFQSKGRWIPVAVGWEQWSSCRSSYL